MYVVNNMYLVLYLFCFFYIFFRESEYLENLYNEIYKYSFLIYLILFFVFDDW